MEPNKMGSNGVQRDKLGRVIGGVLNPEGRPKGKTMKEFAREYLANLTPEDKLQWLKDLPKEIVWRMSEGNPHNTTDLTSGDKPIPILGYVPGDNSNKEDQTTE